MRAAFRVCESETSKVNAIFAQDCHTQDVYMHTAFIKDVVAVEGKASQEVMVPHLGLNFQSHVLSASQDSLD